MSLHDCMILSVNIMYPAADAAGFDADAIATDDDDDDDDMLH